MFDDRIGLLFRTVGIQECSGDVYDFLSLEVHHQGRLFRYFCHNGRFQVLGDCQFLQCFHILHRDEESALAVGIQHLVEDRIGVKADTWLA